MNNNSCKFYPYMNCINCNNKELCYPYCYKYKRPEMDEELKPFMDNLNNVLPNKS